MSAWSNGFLPSIYQGVRFRSQGDPVLYLSNPDGMDRATRRRSLDTIEELNRLRLEATGDPEIETRMRQYEMAWRMQSSVPELTDFTSEPQSMLDMYGAEPGKKSFAGNCLLARRLLERGVRFVQLYHWGWDSHGTGPNEDIMTSLPKRCEETDRAAAARGFVGLHRRIGNTPASPSAPRLVRRAQNATSGLWSSKVAPTV